MRGIRPRIAPTMTYGIEGTNIYTDIVQGATQLAGIVQQGIRDRSQAELQRERMDLDRDRFKEARRAQEADSKYRERVFEETKRSNQVAEKHRQDVLGESTSARAEMTQHRSDLLKRDEEQGRAAHARWATEFKEKHGVEPPSYDQIVKGEMGGISEGQAPAAPGAEGAIEGAEEAPKYFDAYNPREGWSTRDKNTYNETIRALDNKMFAFLAGSAGVENEADAARLEDTLEGTIETMTKGEFGPGVVDVEYRNDPKNKDTGEGGRGYKVTLDPDAYDRLAATADDSFMSVFSKGGEGKGPEYESKLVDNATLRGFHEDLRGAYDLTTTEGRNYSINSNALALKTVGVSDAANRGAARSQAAFATKLLTNHAKEAVNSAMKSRRYDDLGLDPEVNSAVARMAQTEIDEIVTEAATTITGAAHPDMIAPLITPFTLRVEEATYKAAAKLSVLQQAPEYVREQTQILQSGAFGYGNGGKNVSKDAPLYAETHVESVLTNLRNESLNSEDPLNDAQMAKISAELAERMRLGQHLDSATLKTLEEQSPITYKQLNDARLPYMGK